MKRSSTYTVVHVPHSPDLSVGPADLSWAKAQVAAIACFRQESSRHRPQSTVKLLYDDDTVYGLFEVRDRYVRSVVTHLGGPVCKDSCVEFFVAPATDSGYVNFEFNAGGTLHASHVRKHARKPGGGFEDYRMLQPEEAGQVKIAHSLPAVVDPEITVPVDWWLAFAIPFRLLNATTGSQTPRDATAWRANFFKCGDLTSHPHWASWNPVPQLNFHDPGAFGTLVFSRNALRNPA